MKVWVQHEKHHQPHSAPAVHDPASLVPEHIADALPSYI